jgi:hypothetical protein
VRPIRHVPGSIIANVVSGHFLLGGERAMLCSSY